MGILQRMNRIVKANIHDVIDRAENPEKMLKQLIREMEDAVRETQAHTAQAIAGLKKLEKRSGENQAQAKLWEDRAVLALEKNDEDLARQALRRKKLYADQQGEYAAQIESQQRSVETLKTTLAALRAKLDEAKVQSRLLIARAQRAKTQQRVQQVVNRGTDTSAFEDFERMTEKIEERELEVVAATELQMDTLDERFEREEEQVDVEFELQQLKERMAQETPRSEG
jgi:phage shock protein A